MDIELGNGGGGGGNDDDAAVVSRVPSPADPQAKEPQPFAWLRAAAYLVVVLAGVALFAGGLVLISTNRCAKDAADTKPSRMTRCEVEDVWYQLLGIAGLALLAMVAFMTTPDQRNRGCCAARLDQADD